MQWFKNNLIINIVVSAIFTCVILSAQPVLAEEGTSWDFFSSCTPANHYCLDPQPCNSSNNNCQEFKDDMGTTHYGCDICPGYDISYCSSSPQVEGEILSETTNAPIPGVWVEWKDKNGNTRYAQTDANGRYKFFTWFNCLNNKQLEIMNQTKIDANLDGTLDDKDPMLFTGGIAAYNCGTTPAQVRVFPSAAIPEGSCNELELAYPNTSGKVDLSDPEGKVCRPLAEKQENRCENPILDPQIIKCKTKAPPTPTTVKVVGLKSLDEDVKASQVGTPGNFAFSCLSTEVCGANTSGPTPTSGPSTTPGVPNKTVECSPKKLKDITSRKVLLNGIGEIHRKLSFSKDTPVWVLECIQEGSTYTCTTGSSTEDKKVFGGKDNYATLNNKYGYVSAMYQAGQTDPVTQPITDANKYDSFEWESQTPKKATSSVFMITYSTTGIDALAPGSFGGQQLASLSFNTSCQLLQDPYGRVFDSKTLEPLSGATVQLLKESNGKYSLEQNAQTTAEDGSYSFYVKDGTYKLQASAKGYNTPKNKSTLNPFYASMYSHIYSGEPIVQNGKIEQRDIPLEPQNLQQSIAFAKENPIKILNSFQSVDKKNKKYIIEGKVSHPKAAIAVYANKHTDNGQLIRSHILARTDADMFGRFTLSFPLERLKTGETVGELEAVKKKIVVASSVTNKTTEKLNPVLDAVQGYAYDESGKLIPGAVVEVTVPFSNQLVYKTKADSNGYFAIDSAYLPPAPYSFSFTTLNGTKETVSTRTFVAQNKNYSFIASKGNVNDNVLGISDMQEDENKKGVVAKGVLFVIAVSLAILIASVYKVYRHSK